MATNDLNEKSDRRRFLGTIATGAAAIGLSSLASPLKAQATEIAYAQTNADDPEAIFKNLKGSRKVVFDATEPNGVFPFAWPRIFLLTNGATGAAEKDINVVVVLRHSAIGYAMDSSLWTKYKFGEFFKADDPATKAASLRNPFWQPKPGDFIIPGVGQVAIGINELQASGVIFVVCNVAMGVYSAMAADAMKMNAEDVKKEWMAGLLPGIQAVPSGVWALGRAQHYGCAYIFAG